MSTEPHRSPLGPFDEFEGLLLAEMLLGLKPLSFTRLVKPTFGCDWAFTLAVNAYLEGAMSILLRHRKARLDEPFEERWTFAKKAMQMFRLRELRQETEYRDFFSALNQLRNSFAHDPRNTETPLNDYFARQPGRDQVTWYRRLAVAYKDIEIPRSELPRLKVTAKVPGSTAEKVNCRMWAMAHFPRIAIWDSGGKALQMIALAYYGTENPDGTVSWDEYRPQLQDLMHDAHVVGYQKQLTALARRVLGQSESSS